MKDYINIYTLILTIDMKSIDNRLFSALVRAMFAIGMLGASLAASAADNVDSEGYPVMYVRGAFGGWGVDEAYRMTRQGDVYTITLPKLDGEFKFSGTDWQFNYGGNSSTPVIDREMTVAAIQDGVNYRADNLADVTFSFTLVTDGDRLGASKVTVTTSASSAVSGLSGTLPVLYVNVYADADRTQFDDEILSKDLAHKNYFSNSEYWLDDPTGELSVGSKSEPLPLEIKARGNWTRRGYAKKPFKIKLGSKQSLLGLSKSKHFALLAHADDNWGYMRNFAGFNLGKRIGLPWTPSQQPVELVVNGDYRGIYFLTESIRVDKDRVNISSLADNETDPELITGGYLVELDNYDETNQIRLTEQSFVGNQQLDRLRITFDTPEEYSDAQRNFVTSQFEAMNAAVGSCSDELWTYMDLDDAARYYLVEEIMSHAESYHGSTYLYLDRGDGETWHFSPLWDFGQAFVAPTDGFFYDHDPYGNTWIPSMRANPTFNAKVSQLWLSFMREGFDGLYDDMEEYSRLIAEAARADRRRWKDASVPAGGAPVADNSDMTRRCQAAISHIKAKTEWLKTHFGDYSAAIDAVETDPLDAPTEYFNLQGIRVAAPTAPGLYIRRRANLTDKIIVR